MIKSEKKNVKRLLKLLKYFNKKIKKLYSRKTFMFFYEKIKKSFYFYRKNNEIIFMEQEIIFSTIESYPCYIKQIKKFRIFIELSKMPSNQPFICKTTTEYFLHQNFLLIIRRRYKKIRKLLMYLENKLSIKKIFVDNKGATFEYLNIRPLFKKFNKKYNLIKRNTEVILNYHLKMMKFAAKLEGKSETEIEKVTLDYISFFYEKLYAIFRITDYCFTDDLNISSSKLQYFKDEIKENIKYTLK